MLTIFTATYNEEAILPGMVAHYRERFPTCQIYVYDSLSTDRTTQIATDSGCHVLEYENPSELDDTQRAAWKNKIWKSADTDWVLVCDADEWLDISQKELQAEESLRVSHIRSTAWHMVSDQDGDTFEQVTRGIRDKFYDKVLLFNKTLLTDIRYSPGAHYCSPRGHVKASNRTYDLWHMRFLSESALLQRVQHKRNRMSARNNRMRYGNENWRSNELLLSEFHKARKDGVAVRNPDRLRK